MIIDLHEQEHEILVFIAFVPNPLINTHANISRGSIFLFESSLV